MSHNNRLTVFMLILLTMIITALIYNYYQMQLIKSVIDNKRNNNNNIEKMISINDNNNTNNTDTNNNNYNNNNTNNANNNNDRSNNNKSKSIKLVIYHMDGCGHCHDLVEKKQINNKSILENLKEYFKNDPDIMVIDYKYGRDEIVKTKGIMYFPTINLEKHNETIEYNGNRDLKSLVDYCKANKESQ